jgi:protein-disulfide isomerase
MKRYLQGRNAVFVGVGVAAVAVAVVLILVSVLGSSGGTKASTGTTPVVTTPGTTEAEATVPGTAQTVALFRGIPQRLNGLGNPKAKATMVEFADLQCPYCRNYTLDALPTIVKEYVRTGKLRLVFSGMEFIGADSDKALRAVYAAGLQGKLWQFLDLLYKSQGAENTGWVTDGLLREVGDSIPGFDTEKMMAARQSAEVEAALAASAQQASSARVNQTPTFFAGPTGGTLQLVPVSALTADAFRPTLDPLVG